MHQKKIEGRARNSKECILAHCVSGVDWWFHKHQRAEHVFDTYAKCCKAGEYGISYLFPSNIARPLFS